MEVQALPLRPDLAKVGVEIRVVGYTLQANFLNLETTQERNSRNSN